MFDLLLNLQIAAFPVAFAVMLVAGTKMYFRIRQKSAALFSLGIFLVLLSQAILFGSEKLWPPVYDRALGIVSSANRDTAFLISEGLVSAGLLLSAISLAHFAWLGWRIEPQQGVQADVHKKP